MVLVDTNVLLRIAQRGHPHQRPALDAIELLRVRKGEVFAIAPQIVCEMCVVCIRPAADNGLGMTPHEAHAEITRARALFHLLPETGQVYPTCEGLVVKYAIRGKRAHDVRLVALMIEHGVPTLLSFNDADFRQFTEIVTLSPFDVLSIPRT